MSQGTADLELIACVVATDSDVTVEVKDGETFAGIGTGATIGPDGQPWVLVTIRQHDGRSAIALLDRSVLGEFIENLTAATTACSSCGAVDATAH
ncbi:hypothetical protein [Sphingobium yanoikuyae]|uniref:hypothetical protein n=1 Tax=Sphingobium yanoikuyae TaxID=13690 RepID=UPI00242A381A|nr:hypothetical protein [Sphingobium yanoikuyae]